VDQIKKLLPKCQNIKSLYLSEASSDSSYELLLSSVIDNCPRLESIAFNPSFISKETLRLFGQRFGHKLKHLEFLKEGFIEKKELILSLCPNLKSLYCADYLWLDFSGNEFNPNLEEIKLYVDLCSDEDVTAFNIFADKYHKKIKDITVSLLCDELPIFSELMTNFSVFPKLKSLTIEIFCTQSFDQWLQVLNHVLVESSDKLVCLKKLRLEFTTSSIPDLEKVSDSYFDLANFLINFKTLEEFFFESSSSYRYIITSSVDTIISLMNLKKFAIDCYDIDHKFYSIISKLMPNLRTFETNRISNECLPYLSSLKLLTRIAIHSFRSDESLVVQLVKNCPQIRRICLLSCEMKRSKETNEELKTLIESRPKLWIEIEEMEEIEDWGTDKVEEPE